MSKRRVLRWGEHPGLFAVITRLLIRGRKKVRVRVRDLTIAPRVGVVCFEGGEGAMGQGRQGPALLTPAFSPVQLTSDF